MEIRVQLGWYDWDDVNFSKCDIRDTNKHRDNPHIMMQQHRC